MTPDELKNSWQSLGHGAPRPLDRDKLDRITSGRLTGARERLARMYFRMFAIVAPFGVVAVLFNLFNGMMPLWMCLAFIGFFVVAALMDLWLWRGIRGMDLNTMGVEEVAQLARYYRSWHLRFQGILIPLAVVLVTLFAMEAIAIDVSLLYGIIAGGIIGLTFGLVIWLRMMKQYKELMRQE